MHHWYSLNAACSCLLVVGSLTIAGCVKERIDPRHPLSSGHQKSPQALLASASGDLECEIRKTHSYEGQAVALSLPGEIWILNQTINSLTIEGKTSHCQQGPTTSNFIMDKTPVGPNNKWYYFKPLSGPPNRRILKLAIKPCTIPPLTDPGSKAWFTYWPTTGMWTAAAGASAYFWQTQVPLYTIDDANC